MFYVVTGLLMGFVFGWALEKSRVFEPGMIVGQMQLRNFIMVKVFLTAVATGLVVISAMYGLGYAKLHIKELQVTAIIVGGLLLGIGITISGACPGTVLAQAGAGYRDAWFTILGGITGAAAFGYFEPRFRDLLSTTGADKPTFVDLTGLDFWQIGLPVAAIIVMALLLIEKVTPWRSEHGENGDGYFETPFEAPDHVTGSGQLPGRSGTIKT